MVGDTLIIDGVEMEVVWNGGPLLANRDTKVDDSWTAPPRRYTKTGRHTKRVDNLNEPPQTIITKPKET